MTPVRTGERSAVVMKMPTKGGKKGAGKKLRVEEEDSEPS